MSNIRDVAQQAGVSVATVSRALQQPDLVSLKTRTKVLTAVKQLGYKPNLMAVKFRSGKTRNLVVLVPTVANVIFCPGDQRHAASCPRQRVFLVVMQHAGR